MGAVDNPILRLPDGTPVIPGSSIKGVFRTLAETYLCVVAEEKPKESRCTEALGGVGGCQEFLEECVVETRDIEDDRKCINHSLFGSQKVFSHLIFHDLYPKENTTTYIKPGVGIDRFLRSSAEKVLYRDEYIAPGTKWVFKLRILDIFTGENEWCCTREVLAYILNEFTERGIPIGGRKSVIGATIKLTNPQVYTYEIKPGKVERKKQSYSWLIQKLNQCQR